MKNKKLFAFWNYPWSAYHGFEGVIGAEVVDMNPTGAVLTREYGPGHYFKPVRLMPLKEGRALHARLEQLREDYANKMRSVNAEYEKKFKELFG